MVQIMPEGRLDVKVAPSKAVPIRPDPWLPTACSREIWEVGADIAEGLCRFGDADGLPRGPLGREGA